MKASIDKSFEKDVKAVKDKKVLAALAGCIESVLAAPALSDIPSCKKMKGAKNAYRIRIGDYRAGVFFEDQTVVFVRFLRRDEIYRFFPD